MLSSVGGLSVKVGVVKSIFVDFERILKTKNYIMLRATNDTVETLSKIVIYLNDFIVRRER